MSMVTITFVPENDNFLKAANLYDHLWREEGDQIVSAIEVATGLKFKEKSVTATVYDGMSWSDPLKLRGSYDADTKKATLVHGLLHRLSKEYMLKLPINGDELSLGLHKQIDLVLYDLWCALYGTAFADRQVEVEVGRAPLYATAWRWTLSLPQAERQAKFATLVALAQSGNTRLQNNLAKKHRP